MDLASLHRAVLRVGGCLPRLAKDFIYKGTQTSVHYCSLLSPITSNPLKSHTRAHPPRSHCELGVTDPKVTPGGKTHTHIGLAPPAS